MNKKSEKMLWKVLGISQKTDQRNNKYYICQCVCGVVREVRASSFGKDSFGCKKCRNATRTHGESGTRLHNIWSQMLNRCKNPSQIGYKHYVGKGIKVCEEWEVFEVFRYWAITHGYHETLTIDRIDNDKGYNPENCRWVTPAQQNRNQTSNIRVKMGTGDLILKDWCRLLGFNYDSVRHDIHSGMTPEQALRKRM